MKDIKDYYRYRFFIQNRFSFQNKIYIQPSLRLDYYQILRKTYLSPRISISYPIDDITTLRTIWGIYYQSPGYEKIRDQNILFDLSPKYTETLNAEKATHYILSLERWLTPEWNAKLEGYFKKLDDLIIQKKVLGTKFYTTAIPGKDLRLADGWTQPVVVSSDSLTQIPINGSDGNAYGVEFILEKRNISASSSLSGWISYSYSFANRNEDGKTIPFRFDRRHVLNFVLNYKLNSWLELGMRWQYATGFPFTKPVGVKPRIVLKDVNGDKILEPTIATRKSYSDPFERPMVIFDIDYGQNPVLYNDRKPDYHRLDIRLTAYTKFWGLDWSFYLDVINVYNRKNIINYDYYINPDLTIGKRANSMFPIIPTIGMSARF
ncbi:MAG: TonB-dependent receptor [Ignavibacteria bacterium]|nr:TonB-dependent receptor [Ignavibacteria bacterium]